MNWKSFLRQEHRPPRHGAPPKTRPRPENRRWVEFLEKKLEEARVEAFEEFDPRERRKEVKIQQFYYIGDYIVPLRMNRRERPEDRRTVTGGRRRHWRRVKGELMYYAPGRRVGAVDRRGGEERRLTHGITRRTGIRADRRVLTERRSLQALAAMVGSWKDRKRGESTEGRRVPGSCYRERRKCEDRRNRYQVPRERRAHIDRRVKDHCIPCSQDQKTWIPYHYPERRKRERRN